MIGATGGLTRQVETADVVQLREKLRNDGDIVKKLQDMAKTEDEQLRMEGKFMLNQLAPENF